MSSRTLSLGALAPYAISIFHPPSASGSNRKGNACNAPAGRPLSVSLLEGTYGPMTLRWRDVLDDALEVIGREYLALDAGTWTRCLFAMAATDA